MTTSAAAQNLLSGTESPNTMSTVETSTGTPPDETEMSSSGTLGTLATTTEAQPETDLTTEPLPNSTTQESHENMDEPVTEASRSTAGTLSVPFWTIGALLTVMVFRFGNPQLHRDCSDLGVLRALFRCSDGNNERDVKEEWMDYTMVRTRTCGNVSLSYVV